MSLHLSGPLRKETTLPPSALRVLAVILDMTQRGKRVTYRAICEELGTTGPNYAWLMTQRLVRAGLVAIQKAEGADKACCAAIRPTCRMLLWKEYLPTARQ